MGRLNRLLFEKVREMVDRVSGDPIARELVLSLRMQKKLHLLGLKGAYDDVPVTRSSLQEQPNLAKHHIEYVGENGVVGVAKAFGQEDDHFNRQPRIFEVAIPGAAFSTYFFPDFPSNRNERLVHTLSSHTPKTLGDERTLVDLTDEEKAMFVENIFRIEGVRTSMEKRRFLPAVEKNGLAEMVHRVGELAFED